MQLKGGFFGQPKMFLVWSRFAVVPNTEIYIFHKKFYVETNEKRSFPFKNPSIFFFFSFSSF